MTTLSQNVNILGELQAARKPSWFSFTTPNFDGAPSAADKGAALGATFTNGSPAARVLVQMREEVWRRSARITVDTFDGSADYTVSINGTAVATTAGSFANADAVLVAMKAKLDADATVGQGAATPVVDSELLDSNGAVTAGSGGGGNAAVTLRVFGESDVDYYVDVSATGSGVLACKADPTSAVARVWLTARGSADSSAETAPDTLSWALAKDGNTTLDYRGLAKNLDVGGWERCYVELDSVDGHASDGASVTYADANSPLVYLAYAQRETD